MCKPHWWRQTQLDTPECSTKITKISFFIISCSVQQCLLVTAVSGTGGTDCSLYERRECRLSTNQKIIGLIPSSSSPHVNVSLGTTLNPEFLLMAVPLVCEWLAPSDGQVGTPCGNHQCVNGVNVICGAKHFKGWKKDYIHVVLLPFTCIILQLAQNRTMMGYAKRLPQMILYCSSITI